MITEIEIDGFKTFEDFELELSPFQVLIGPNGSGKSNLFDAIHLLSCLAETDLHTAFHDSHGEMRKLFTIWPNDSVRDTMRFAVEMLLDRKVSVNADTQVDLQYTRLRYEIAIKRCPDAEGNDQLFITHEALRTIGREQDHWRDQQGLSGPNPWIPEAQRGPIHFISTEVKDDGTTLIHLHHEEDKGQGTMVAEQMRQSVLSQVSSITWPHALAVREEMRHWKRLRLNPEVLRQPSPMDASPFLSPEGQNLAAALARMQREDPLSIRDVRLNLGGLTSMTKKITVDTDQAHQRYVIRVEVREQGTFPVSSLSEGILRMLALATVKNDPDHHGVLCFEEPELGALPDRFSDVARVLRGLATDLLDEEEADFPLRQLLATTHSPAFISQEQIRDALLFTHMPTRITPRNQARPPHGITDIDPVVRSQAHRAADPSASERENWHVSSLVGAYLRQYYFNSDLPNEMYTNLTRV